MNALSQRLSPSLSLLSLSPPLLSLCLKRPLVPFILLLPCSLTMATLLSVALWQHKSRLCHIYWIAVQKG